MAGTIFWLLVGASGIFLIFGLVNKSWKAFIGSGITVLLPSLYFLGAENWLRVLALVPLFPIGLGIFYAKSTSKN